jgi:hypothetical protein
VAGEPRGSYINRCGMVRLGCVADREEADARRGFEGRPGLGAVPCLRFFWKVGPAVVALPMESGRLARWGG